MDLREKKTRRSIQNAFLQLRSRKPLERITVKELSELAEISKATFYLHYRDLYDLSDAMGRELVQDLMKRISQPECVYEDPARFIQELTEAFYAEPEKLDIVFSDSQTQMLPRRLEDAIREIIFREHPELQDDVTYNVWLTYQIQGSYYAYRKHREQFGNDKVLEAIKEIGNRF